MKRFLALIIALCMLVLSVPATFAAEQSFTINGVTVTPSSGTAGTNCATYASQILKKIWNYNKTTTTFSSEYNMLSGKSASERKITEAHVKEYIQAAPLGSRLRISHYSSETIDNYDNNNYGHTMVLVAKDNVAGNFTTLEAGAGYGKGVARTYTYKGFVDEYASFNQHGVIGYTYFFYIADLTSFGTEPKANEPSNLKINIGTSDYPTGALTQGSYFSLKGTITSNYMITSVKGEIISNGIAVDSYTQTASTKNYSLYNSKVDLNLEFNKLPAGTYYLKYTATDSSGKTVTWSSQSNMFTVGGGPTPSYTVSFDPNGGSVSPTTKTLEIGTRLTGMPTPTRTGYIFRGWAMDKIDPDGSGVSVTTVVADGVWTFDKDTTLYAHWEKQATANPLQNTTDGITKPTSFDYSGKFGVNNALTWGLNTGTGVLVLSGNGKMQNWSNAEYRPWAKLRNSVTGVIIEDGIQNLGRYTLARCENMTSVSIPESVTEISDGVFTRAYSLGSIELPQSLTTIGSGAFSECTSLRSITIPKNVDFIETGAFGSCTNLESIYFCGNAPSYFGDNGVVRLNMFSGCRNLTVYYPANSSGWTPIIEKYTDVTWKPWNPGNTTSPNSPPTASNTTTWGTWSAWSSTPYSASGTREVETQQVKISDAYTEYRYGLWRNANNASWCPDYGASLSSSGGSWYEAYSNWSTTRMCKDTGHNAFCSDRNHNHTHVSGYDSNGWANWDIYSDDGTFTGWGRLYYYWEETRTIPAVYETQYRYRDLISA